MHISGVHVLQLENGRWECKNVTTDSLATKQTLLFEIVYNYVDSSVLLFGKTRCLVRDLLSTRVLELRELGNVWDIICD